MGGDIVSGLGFLWMGVVSATVDGDRRRTVKTYEGAHDVRWDGVELLGDDRGFRVDCLDDGGSEEGQTLDCDVVQEEDEGSCESDWGQDSL